MSYFFSHKLVYSMNELKSVYVKLMSSYNLNKPPASKTRYCVPTGKVEMSDLLSFLSVGR